MTTPTPTRSPSPRKPPTPPFEEGKVRQVFRGGWFIVEDANGERMVVRLPARVERGA
jgi:hypothetical protein